MNNRNKTEEMLSKSAAAIHDMMADYRVPAVIVKHYNKLVEAHMTYEAELREQLAQYEPELPELAGQLEIKWRN